MQSYTRPAITAQNFKFNSGSELNETTKWYQTPFRNYDPALGRFHGVDAHASLYSSWTPSHFGGNNPIMYSDPTGLDRIPLPGEATKKSSGPYYTQQNGGYNNGMSALPSGDGSHWNDGFIAYAHEYHKAAHKQRQLKKDLQEVGVSLDNKGVITWFAIDESGYMHALGGEKNYGAVTIEPMTINLGGFLDPEHVDVTAYRAGEIDDFDPNELAPWSLGRNIFNMHYPGGDNPINYLGDPDYSTKPKNIAGYPAIGHDRRYDNLDVHGAGGLFLDTKAIGADWQFVKEEFAMSIVSFMANDPATGVKAAILAVGLGVSATPKTLWTINAAGRMLSKKFFGNQYVNKYVVEATKATSAKIANYVKGAGGFLTAVNVGYTYNEWTEGRASGMDLGASAVGFLGVPGMIVSGGYSLTQDYVEWSIESKMESGLNKNDATKQFWNNYMYGLGNGY